MWQLTHIACSVRTSSTSLPPMASSTKLDRQARRYQRSGCVAHRRHEEHEYQATNAWIQRWAEGRSKPVVVWGPDGADPTYVAPGYFRNVEKGQDVLDSQSEAATSRAKKEMDKMTPAELADAKADLARELFNARINVLGGDSGGPILDQQGRVVGINDFSDDKSDSDFTPVDKLIALMNETKPKFNFVHKPDKDGNLI